MGTSKSFKETIKAYLDKRAAEDAMFAKSYAKEGKTIEQCCDYIYGEVRYSGSHVMTDEEVYGMAVHYYDEDNITVDNCAKCRVVHTEAGRTTAKEANPHKKTATQSADVQLSLF